MTVPMSDYTYNFAEPLNPEIAIKKIAKLTWKNVKMAIMTGRRDKQFRQLKLALLCMSINTVALFKVAIAW